MRRVATSLIFLPVVLFVLLIVGVRLLEVALQPITYDALAGVGPFFIFATYFVMGCITVPLLLVALWRRWVSLWHAVAVGVLSGLFAVSLPLWPLLADQRLHLHYRLAKLVEGYPFVLLGAAGGLIFWFLGIYRNPALQAKRGVDSGRGQNA